MTVKELIKELEKIEDKEMELQYIEEDCFNDTWGLNNLESIEVDEIGCIYLSSEKK